MSHPTKQQWDEFKKKLSGRYGSQYLQCDGYAVAIQIQMNKNRVLHYVIYANGLLNGKWIKAVKEDEIHLLPEESKRFYCHHKKSKPAKEIKMYESIYGKRQCKKDGLYIKQVLAMPFWKSLNSLIAHFKKYNQHISIITAEEHDLLVEKQRMACEQGVTG